MLVNTYHSCTPRTASDLKGTANILDKRGLWKRKESATALPQRWVAEQEGIFVFC